VDVSAKPAGRVYIITLDPGIDRILYYTSLDGFATATVMVGGTNVQVMEGTSGSGPATAQVEANIYEGGFWVTWHDDNGNKVSIKITDSETWNLTVSRLGWAVLVAFRDPNTGEVKAVVVDTVLGEVVHTQTLTWLPETSTVGLGASIEADHNGQPSVFRVETSVTMASSHRSEGSYPVNFTPTY
jgi:hypothetical protein